MKVQNLQNEHGIKDRDEKIERGEAQNVLLLSNTS